MTQSRSATAFLPVASAAALAACTLLPRIGGVPPLRWSFLAAAAALLVWWARVRQTRKRPTVVTALRSHHYLQALAHSAIFVYWGLHWEPIRDAAPLILAQVIFAYGFDMMLGWARRGTYTLGFGPFPIVFSTNLFLRFTDDWFALQFVMIAVGFAAKEFLTWERDGRRTHIFNPSSFPLALASLLLIATGTTDITWGESIASDLFVPPEIFLFIFLVSLPSQFLFGVTPMTLAAVVTTWLWGEAYLASTGTYFFVDDYVPIAVFLGMHLLFTDPATSPRTELGRVAFGVLYGASVVALYVLLPMVGAPTFYDKLLQVPLLNLMVRGIDRMCRSAWLVWWEPVRDASGLASRARRGVWTSVWVLTFAGLSATNVLGDHHPGHSVLFWDEACREGRPRGCEVLGLIVTQHCGSGSGWACNEAGVLMAEGRLKDNTPAAQAFTRACRFGFDAGCRNLERLGLGPPYERDRPPYRDYPILLSTGKGRLPVRPPEETYDAACKAGWTAACQSLADIRGEIR